MVFPKAISVVQKTPLISLTKDSLFLQLSPSSNNSSYSTLRNSYYCMCGRCGRVEPLDIYICEGSKPQRPKDLLNIGRQVREDDEC